MSRHVALTWAYGGGLGHVARLHVLAQGFVRRGWRVSLVASDLEAASRMAWPDGMARWQAPIWPQRAASPLARDRYPAASMSSLLLNSGWDDAALLQHQWLGWRTVLDHLRPNVVVSDFAPGAGWVARHLGLPCINVGVVSVPACGNPMPALCWWSQRHWPLCAQHDEVLLASVNTAAAALGCPPWETAGQAWQADVEVLSTLPALDHGAAWGRPRLCWGLLAGADAGAPPVWPPGDGTRVLVYMSGKRAALATLVAALRAIGARALVVSPDASSSQVTAWCAAGAEVSTRPLAFETAARAADVVCTEGNHGTTAQALRAGKPMLLFPNQLERRCTARRVADSGAALLAEEQATVQELANKLLAAVGQARWRQAAERIAADPVARRSVEQVVELVVDAAEHL